MRKADNQLSPHAWSMVIWFILKIVGINQFHNIQTNDAVIKETAKLAIIATTIAINAIPVCSKMLSIWSDNVFTDSFSIVIS